MEDIQRRLYDVICEHPRYFEVNKKRYSIYPNTVGKLMLFEVIKRDTASIVEILSSRLGRLSVSGMTDVPRLSPASLEPMSDKAMASAVYYQNMLSMITMSNIYLEDISSYTKNLIEVKKHIASMDDSLKRLS